jgi:hypothetical protein
MRIPMLQKVRLAFWPIIPSALQILPEWMNMKMAAAALDL